MHVIRLRGFIILWAALCVCVFACACVHVRERVMVFMMYFNLTQTALFMEGGGGTHRTGWLILLHCDMEVRENTHHHCCSHLHLGSGVQHSRACKTSILKLTSLIFITHFIVFKHITSCLFPG